MDRARYGQLSSQVDGLFSQLNGDIPLRYVVHINDPDCRILTGPVAPDNANK